MKDGLNWYKNNLEPQLIDCEIEHKYYATGDFGSLDQIRINSSLLEVQVDFWGLDWLGVYVFDKTKEIELLNVLSKGDEKAEQIASIESLITIMQANNALK